jgi:hypothetical protein
MRNLTQISIEGEDTKIFPILESKIGDASINI